SDDDTSKDSQDYLLEDSSEDMIKFLSRNDPQWQFPKQSHKEELKHVIVKTEEEDPLPIDVPMQTKEKDPLLDIVYPLQEIASTSRGTNTRGEALEAACALKMDVMRTIDLDVVEVQAIGALDDVVFL
ncbi:hypothetical protein Tco_1553634, partial [Tanacetum coccineum]